LRCLDLRAPNPFDIIIMCFYDFLMKRTRDWDWDWDRARDRDWVPSQALG